MASDKIVEMLECTLAPRLTEITAKIFPDCVWHIEHVQAEVSKYVNAEMVARLYQPDGRVAYVPATHFEAMSKVFADWNIATVLFDGYEEPGITKEENYLTSLPS